MRDISEAVSEVPKRGNLRLKYSDDLKYSSLHLDPRMMTPLY